MKPENFFAKFYLDKEKDIVVKLFKSENPDELIYVIRTPNHHTGNLITNLAKLANAEISYSDSGVKIIQGTLKALINDNGEDVYKFGLGGIKIANIYPDGRIERKAKIPAIIKLFMAQTKDYRLPVEKTIIKSYILKQSKLRTDLHTHMHQILQPDLLIALGIKHQIGYSLYYIKKLGIELTEKQEKFLNKKRQEVEKEFKNSNLPDKQLTRKIDDNVFINLADLILNNIEKAEKNINKIRNSLVLLKDGQAVFTNLEKTILYRNAIIRAKTVDKKEQIDLTVDKIEQIEDNEVRQALIQMLKDNEIGSGYENNTFYKDKLLWIAREYQKQGIKYVEIANYSPLCKKGLAGIKNIAEMHEILPKVEKETGVKIRFLAAAHRDSSLFSKTQLKEYPAVIRAIAKSPYIVGMDLIGEEINNVTDFSDTIGEIIDYALNEDPEFTIRLHAGETDAFKDNIEKALDCVKLCVPNGKKAPQVRLGHGLYVPDLDSKDGKRIIKKMKDLDVVLEFQLSSNVRLNNLTDLNHHPMKKYLEDGIKCVQGTDGCGFYGIDTIDEQIALRNLLGITDEDFAKMRAVEEEIMARRDKYFIEKSKKFEEFLNDRSLEDALMEEEEKQLANIDLNEDDIPDNKTLNSYKVFENKIVDLPTNKTPIIIAGGSFNAKGRITMTNEDTKKALKEFLEKVDDKNTYIVIGHKMQGYESAVLDISKELNKHFDVTAVVPKFVTEDVRENIENVNGLKGIYVCPDPSELGIYKSFNYEIFERRNSVVVAFDGNSPVSNLIQEAKNGKGKAKIYVNADVDVLKEKANSLDGYVKVFNKNINLADEVLEDNPEIKI